jgi:hypothetical protein
MYNFIKIHEVVLEFFMPAGEETDGRTDGADLKGPLQSYERLQTAQYLKICEILCR